jgi:hypothetical protein
MTDRQHIIWMSDRQHIIWMTDRQGVRVMVFNATFNNITAISWQSVLLLEQTTNLQQVTDI